MAAIDRRLFAAIEAANAEIADGGPDIDQSIGLEDLDPALGDYFASGLFNSSFRDADPEDNEIDYWEITDGDFPLTVADDADGPGGNAIHYEPTGASVEDSLLVSALVPIPHGLDMGVIAVFKAAEEDVEVKAVIDWYIENDEEDEETESDVEVPIATTEGAYKAIAGRQVQWLKIDRPSSAKACSFASVTLRFRATGAGAADLFGVTLSPLTPAAGSDKAHDQVHAIDGPDHSAAGLTPGYVMTALSATTIGFQPSTGSGVSDHGALTGLGDDDHTQYPLMVVQDDEPPDPARPEVLWVDTNADPTDPPMGALTVYLYKTFK